ncbi:patatin-like phospholipase family protein [Spirillospora sp. NPDC047279]|uniref:patatin-like phospholipase family protein n=1 Tax=Spirillospora sp. NPDC047279 TaxID=3155478 RepID=UPI0033D0B37A
MSRALVLGGGGLTGISWEWGILSGLAAAGVDLSDADLVVGTSAGSMVGAQVASGLDFQERFRAQFVPLPPGPPTRLARRDLARSAWAVLSSRASDGVGARLGRIALGAETPSEDEHARLIRSRLPVREWPDRPLMITAVDAGTGTFTVFDRSSGATLLEAVGASCAVPGVYPPVTIGGRRYIDGGARSSTNADLAAGYRSVVVIAPNTQGFRAIESVAGHVRALRRAGSEVALISPDARSRRVFGRDSLDSARRPPAAGAGRRQAASIADTVAAVWEAR